MAAVTLLALGNGAPDVFASVAAVASGNPKTGFGAILSAGYRAQICLEPLDSEKGDHVHESNSWGFSVLKKCLALSSSAIPV
ncbi:Cation/calcium exchanger 5 [Bienertia sinuspersici]